MNRGLNKYAWGFLVIQFFHLQNCVADGACTCTTDADNDTYYLYHNETCTTGNDCNDTNNLINPGQIVDFCDGYDNDCDIDVDEDATITCSSDSQCTADGCDASQYKDYYCLNPGTCSSSCGFVYDNTQSCSTTGSSGGTFTTESDNSPIAKILNPTSGSSFKVGEGVSCYQEPDNYGSSFNWNFGDGKTESQELLQVPGLRQ